jgi:hypothetical protein
MREQPDLYGEDIGFDDFQQFVKHPGEQADFALKEDGQTIAFAYLILRARKVCEFGLVTPPRPRVRSVLAILREWQRDYFESLGFVALYAQYPDDPRYDRPRRLCRMFGWREVKPNYFECTFLDHLKAYYGSKETYSQSEGAV